MSRRVRGTRLGVKVTTGSPSSVMATGAASVPRPARHALATRVVAGVVVLSMVVVGPVVLVWATMHGPWSSVVAAVHQPGLLARLLGRQSDASDLLAVVVLTGWLLWVWAMLGVGSELVALARGRPPLRLPAGALVQRVVGVAVGGMLAAAPLARSSIAVAGSPAPVVPVARHLGPPAVSAGHRRDVGLRVGGADRPARDAVDSAGQWSAAAVVGSSGIVDRPVRDTGDVMSTRLYVVQPGDTLWSIAARELGSPLRWRQIAALNQDRPQPDGQKLVDDHWIYPGWSLVLPAIAPAPIAARPPVPPGTASPGTAVPPEQVLSSVATSTARSTLLPAPAPSSPPGISAGAVPRALGTARPRDVLGAPSAGQQTANGRPRLLHERQGDGADGGEAGRGGGSDDRTSAGPRPDREATAEPRAVLDGRSIGERRSMASAARRPSQAPVVEEAAVFGVLAGGVVLLVDRLRRVQQRHRPDGLRIVLPSRDVAALEGQLRRQADLAPRAVAGSLVAALHVAAAEAGTSVPLVAALRVGHDTSELALVVADDPAVDVDAGLWRDPLDENAGSLLVPGSSPGWWTPLPAAVRRRGPQWPAVLGIGAGSGARRRSGGLEALGGSPPLTLVEPGTLVTLGVEDDQLVLVDLAVLGALGLRGSWATGALRAMAVELASVPMAVEVDLVLVGFSDTFDVFDRARRIDDLERAYALAEACVGHGDGDPGTGVDLDGGDSARATTAAPASPAGEEPWRSAAGPVPPRRRDGIDLAVTTVFLCASPGSPSAVVCGSQHGTSGLVTGDDRGPLDASARLRGSGDLSGPGYLDGLGTSSVTAGRHWEAELARRLAELACASEGLVAVVFGWPVPAAPWQACGEGGRVVLRHRRGGREEPGEPHATATSTAVTSGPATSGAAGGTSDDGASARGWSAEPRTLARVRPQQLSAHRTAQVGSLIRAASNLRGTDPPHQPHDASASASPALASWDDTGGGLPPGSRSVDTALRSPPASVLVAPGPAADPEPTGAAPRLVGTLPVEPDVPDVPDVPMSEIRGHLPTAGTDGATNPASAPSVEGVESLPARADREAPIRHSRVAPGTVEVQILGPVQVVGAERPFSRAWTLDLVVYLALHPAGATTEQWSTALWPDRLMAPASLHSTASAARRALGTDAEGADHLPHGHGRLRLAPSVTSDWQAFTASAAEAGPEGWRRSLALVRGRPFDGLRAVDWAILEGVLPVIESSVVDVANQLASWALEIGDAATAQWAARQGLLVSPYDERLYRVLLRAADLAGNPAGVESTMAELVRLVAEDLEPYDAVHPDTLALYRTLSRRAEQASRR